MAFTLRGIWTMDGASLDKELKKGQLKFDNFSKRVAASIANKFAAAFAVGSIVYASKRMVEFGSKIQDTAQQLQLTTDEVQQFMYAAEQTGTTMENVAVGLAQLARTQRDALDGSEKLTNSFKLLGVSLDTLKTGSRIDVLREIESTIKKGELNTRQLAAASDVLGESARFLFPAMKQGFSEFADQLVDVNGLIGKDQIAALKAAGDEWTTLTFRIRAFAAEFTPLITTANKFVGVMEALYLNLGVPFRFIGAASGGASVGEATKAAISPIKQQYGIGSVPAPTRSSNTGPAEISKRDLHAAYLSFLRQRMDEQINELREINRNTRDGVFK